MFHLAFQVGEVAAGCRFKLSEKKKGNHRGRKNWSVKWLQIHVAHSGITCCLFDLVFLFFFVIVALYSKFDISLD